MKWLKELMEGFTPARMARLPEPMDQTIIPVDLEVGDTDQVVLIAKHPISSEEAEDLQAAWTAGSMSGKVIVLDGRFTIHVLRNLHKPTGDTP